MSLCWIVDFILHLFHVKTERTQQGKLLSSQGTLCGPLWAKAIVQLWCPIFDFYKELLLGHIIVLHLKVLVNGHGVYNCRPRP